MQRNNAKKQVTIQRRFCGPPDSGNGGYVCGLVAGYLAGETEVTLRRPPPLETPLDVRVVEGDRVHLLDRIDLVAEGRLCPVESKVPFRPSFEQARLAAEMYAGFRHHFYPTCFVCGPARAPKDGLRIFAGTLPDSEAVASPWIPHRSLVDETGRVKNEFIWAALDCPGYFAVNKGRHRYMLLGRMAAAVYRRPRAADRCVVAAWHLHSEGRKHFAASALLSENGHLLGCARATWIEVVAPDAAAPGQEDN